MKRFATTTMVCLIALSAAGCAVKVPMSAFQLAPPDVDQTAKPDRSQDIKHVR